MNATVVIWKDGIIVRSYPFQTVAAAKWFTHKFNSTRPNVIINHRPDQRRALLVY